MLCMIMFTQLSAQIESDLHSGQGDQFLQGITAFEPNHVFGVTKPAAEAQVAFKKTKTNHRAASALGFVGVALIGWPLATAATGGEPPWGMAAGGAGLVVIALLQGAFISNAGIAIKLHHKEQGSLARHQQPKLHFGMQSRGMGMSLKF